MSAVSVQAFDDQGLPARALAAALRAPFRTVTLHRFPDGEVMPLAHETAKTVIAYCSLDHPNEKLIALLLACDAWRRMGAARLVLVAPYLCYMRQDRVFRAGEPLSRDVICGLLGSAFDRAVTVDAHLHRTHDLSRAFGGIETQNLSATGPLGEALCRRDRPVVVGPDAESEPWARELAERVGGDVLVFHKTRQGDARIQLQAPDLGLVRGRPVLLVDDICSSGATLIAAAGLLREAAASSIDVGVTHALFHKSVQTRLKAAGVSRIVSTDSVRHPTNRAPLANLLAGALRDEIQA